jgi:hypothetical protein
MLRCVRTTLTLDPDVAALLERVRKARKLGLKEAINDALRRGLPQLTAPERPGRAFRTRSVDAGKCLVGSIDDVHEVLALAEDEPQR